MESWLDYGVLKALGEEAGYRRVDACIILLAVNDTNVRRLWISPGLATRPLGSLRFRASRATRPTRNPRLPSGRVAEHDRTTHLLVPLQPPAATYRRAPRLELGRVLVDPAAAPSLAAHDGCVSKSPSWIAKSDEELLGEFSALYKDTRVSGCAG
jgi:hypothetical protein